MVGCNRLKTKIVLAIAIVTTSVGFASGAGNEWFTFKGNYMRNSSTSLFVEPPVLKTSWSQNLKSPISSSPVISGDDCFISTEGDGKGGSLFCLSAIDGTPQWTFPTTASISQALANYTEDGEKPWPNGAIDFPKAKLNVPITVDGTKLYVPWGQNLLVLNKESGRLLQRYNLAPHSAAITTSPVVSEYFQIIMAGASNGWLYGFDIQNRDPAIRWRLPDPGGTGDTIKSSPAFYNTCVYFGSNSKNLYCIDLKKPPYDKTKGVQPNEKPVLKWQTKLDSAVTSSPAYSAGKIIATTENGMVYSIKDDGSINWKYDTGDKKIESSPAVGKGYVVFAAEKTLYCIGEADGQFKWSINNKRNIVSTPLIGGDYVYFTTLEGKLGVLKLATGASVSTKMIDTTIKSSPAISNGRLYFGSDDGIFYALEKGDASPELGVDPLEIVVPSLPINKIATKEIEIQNKGGGKLAVQIVSSRSWISVDQENFTLDAGEFRVVNVSIDAKGQQANSYKSVIRITSNGGNATVNVSVNIIRNPDKFVNMTIGDKTALINGEPFLLGVAPWKSPKPSNATMVPIRFVEDAFGCNVSWDSKNKKTTIEYEKRKVKMTFTIGKSVCVLQLGNGNPMVIKMYYPATIKENKTCVPIEFMVEIFDARISLDPNNSNKIQVVIPGD